ncbi:M56 family metallopeptidase [uncultured Formosa sp.]|uniref:M56 family metallopeptidase n=1 Tax=uncultured Formosa sp. TaxID=255435 RepID=UPI00261E41C9|nr:M56 family metallopeptidase [uncultured Formosa sp.]
MLHYILQTIAFQLFFLMVYDLFLKRETFFNWNRFYLLFTPIASFVLPLIKIEAFRNVLPQNYIVQLPAVILNPDALTVQTQLLPTVYLKNSSSFWSWEFILYVGISVSIFIFLVKMFKLFRTINISEKNTVNGLTIITLKNSSAAFSFFNYVFLGDAINPENYQTILAHECVHKSQKHSADLLFFELLRIVFWFNPLVYMFQNRMVTLHEYIADALVVKQQDKVTYYQNLLSQVFDVNHISFINPFFKQSLIKKRIIMLTKSKSKQIHLVKYALLVPMIFAMLLYTSCDKEADNSESTEIQTSKDKIQEKIDKIMEENPNVKIKIIEEDSLIDEDIEVPYSVVEQVPIFPGCEDLPAEEQKKCFSNKVSQFVGKHFNTDLGKEQDIKGMQRINTIFKIDKNGNVLDVKARADHEIFQEEAIRVLNLLPKMQPGKQKGKEVTVPYSLPIVFQVHE